MTTFSADVAQQAAATVIVRNGKARWLLAASIVLGLTAVYSSSAHMAQFPHGTVVLPWRFPSLAILSFVGCGLALGTYVLIRPDHYWATLVGATVLTAGMFVLRFPLYDEWLAVAIAAGGACACALRRVPIRRHNLLFGWVAIFIGLCLYLLLEVGVGLWLYGNMKSLRYLITFSAIALIGWTTARYEVPVPVPRQITLLLALSGMAYYLLVLLHGALFPTYAWEITLEGIGGAGSSHECVAGVVAMPAAMILIGERHGWRKVLGAVLLVVSLLVTLFADARSGMVAIAGSLLIATIGLRPRVSVALWVSAGAGAFLIGALVEGRSAWILDIIQATIEAGTIRSGAIETQYFGEIVAHAQGDAGRAYYVKGGIETLRNEGPRVALMGTGIYGYFPVAGKHYEEAARRAGIPTFVINLGSGIGGVQEPPRPPALGVLIAETGLIGLFLLCGCAALAVVSAMMCAARGGRRRRAVDRSNLLVAGTVVLAMVWTYFGDAPDTVFFFLLIMPHGIVHSWGRLGLEDATEARGVRAS